MRFCFGFPSVERNKMTALKNAMTRSRAVVNSAHASAMNKQADIGGTLAPVGGGNAFAQSREATGNRNRYGQFHGWLYSAINARAREAAGQPFCVARLEGATPNPEERSSPGTTKVTEYHRKMMTADARRKAAGQELQIQQNHVLIDAIEKPNSVQNKWQFVYSFFASLDLTGVAYIIADRDADGNPEFFSLPTTWVRPDHTKGLFAEYRIVNPSNPVASKNDKPLDGSQVARAYYPNPAHPLGAFSPAQAQSKAIRIDDRIQTSQEAFFDNGIFPSVIVTVGKDPIPGLPGGGTRPRLTGIQRRQIHGAIRRVMSNVTQHGTPAIVDGLIENIERWSATQNEMGWEKSEDAVKARILSTFPVHPFILGAAMPGSYSQAYVVENRFCKGVNTGLDLLSTLMTSFAGPMVDEDERTLIWWVECAPNDPKIRADSIIKLRANDDITKNEIRAEFGFPPDESVEEQQGNKLLQAVGGLTQMMAVFDKLAAGTISSESAAQVIQIFFGLPIERARDIVSGSGETTVAQAVETLAAAVRVMNVSPAEIAGRITDGVK